MIVYPAIDLRDGRCVRLHQGDYGKETVYGDDPVAQALAFADAGATWVHVVDLDAARTGAPTNRAAITAIAGALAERGVRVQTGGGVRSVADAGELHGAGVARVVLGTAAVADPGLVDAAAETGVLVALGLDVRDREVAVKGWTEGAGELLGVLSQFEGRPVDALVVTQIAVDGTGDGPDIALYRELLDAGHRNVIASGGVGSLDHVDAVAALGVAGVIVGRALYEGTVDLVEALARALA